MLWDLFVFMRCDRQFVSIRYYSKVKQYLTNITAFSSGDLLWAANVSRRFKWPLKLNTWGVTWNVANYSPKFLAHSPDLTAMSYIFQPSENLPWPWLAVLWWRWGMLWNPLEKKLEFTAFVHWVSFCNVQMLICHDNRRQNPVHFLEKKGFGISI